MKKSLLLGLSLFALPLLSDAQCTTTNATSCVCAQSGSSNCQLLPDMIVARPPLLVSGSNGIIEYSQSGNGANDGRLRLSVSTPNIGHGPLEVRTTNRYVCGTDTITGTAPATCTNTGLPPKQLVVQRVYQKNGNTMTYIERNAGSMTYHPTHGHMHVDDWGIYTLRTQSADPNPLNWPIVGTGAKLAFCLMDYGSCSTYNGHCVDAQGNTMLNGNFPNYGLGGGAYNCSPTVQGISSGYTDIYYQSLDGMWINIPPGTCNGQYYIVVQLDPYNYFLEEDETNNVIVVPYTLTLQSTSPTATISSNRNGAICASDNVTLTAPAGTNFTYLWSNGSTSQSIITNVAGNYVVTVSSPCGSVSSTPYSVTVLAADPATTGASVCGSGSGVLNASSTGSTINWYATPSGGGSLGSGSAFTTPVLSNSTTYYAEATATAGAYSGYSTPNANTIGAGGYFTGSQYMIFDAFQTITLNSVKVYAQTAGSRTVELRNSAGTLITSTTATVPVGESRITLNWNIPAGTDYRITRTGTADLYRNNGGVSYPYTLPGYLSIKNSSAGTANYYFFYDWQISVAGTSCTSSRVGATLTVNTPPSVSISGNNTICAGTSTTLTASGATSYNWSPSTGLNGTSGANVIATPASTTTYTVTGTSANGCTGTQQVTVTVNNSPSLNVSSSSSVCAGNSAVLQVSGANTYSWTPSTGLNTTTGASVTSTPPSTTTYTVTGTDVNGCTASAPVTVTVNPLPTVSVSPFSAICNNAAPLVLTNGSPAGGTYSGNGVAGGSFYPSIAGVGTHSISYNYTDANGCSASASANILVNNCTCVTPATPANIGGVTKPCPGTNSAYVIANVTGATSYTWTLPAGVSFVSGQNTNSVNLAFAPTFTSGSVCVVANNACGSSNSRCKALTANTAKTPGAFVGNLYGNCGANVSLSVPAVTGAVSYNWTLPANCSMISGQGTNAVVFSTPVGFTSGQVCVTSNNGCMNSVARCGMVYNAPAKPTAVIGSNVVCAQQQSVSYSVTPLFGTTNYFWAVPAGSTIVSGQGTPNIVVNFGATAGQVTCSARNACGNNGTRALLVSFNCREGLNQDAITAVSVFPNPANDHFDITFDSAKSGHAEITLTDIAGRVVYNEVIKSTEGFNQIGIQTNHFGKGVYMLNISQEGQISRIKIVIE